MSTNENGLEITRNIAVHSPQEFYKLLKDYNYRIEQLIPFMDRFDIYTNGCACQAEGNFKNVVAEYRNLHMIEMTSLKEIVQCSSIYFYLDDELIFKL